jgi:iron complex outermembrane receptor protein
MIDQSIQVYRIAANSENSVTTKGASIGINYYISSDVSLNGNYSYNELNEKGTNDPIIPAYNTPKHKFNLGLLIKKINFNKFNTILRDYSFGLNYKWIDTFLYEGSPQFTGLIPSYDLLDIQISKFIPQIDATLKFGSTNILNNQHFEVYGGPYIGRMTFFSILFDIN